MRDHLDRFYTPPEVARKCIDTLFDTYLDLETLFHTQKCDVLEPSIGSGNWIRELEKKVTGDYMPEIHGYDADKSMIEALKAEKPNWNLEYNGYELTPTNKLGYDLIIGNPPYSFVNTHVPKALDEGLHVVFLLQASFLASQSRYSWWQNNRPRHVWFLSKRPSFSGNNKTAAQDYALFYWDRTGPTTNTRLGWIK